MLWQIVELVYGLKWRQSRRNNQKYKPQIEQRSAGRHDVIESEVWKCSFYRSLHALVSLNMFIVLSRVMTWIKCRLSSSIFFFFGVTLTFQWEFNFKDSLNIAGVGEKLDFVCTLDAMVRKLISLICFDIFQSKWYRNALIGVPDDKSNSKKKVVIGKRHMFDKRFHERQRINAISAGKRKKEKLTELALLYGKAK